jgi:hypothetical protein
MKNSFGLVGLLIALLIVGFLLKKTNDSHAASAATRPRRERYLCTDHHSTTKSANAATGETSCRGCHAVAPAGG